MRNLSSEQSKDAQLLKKEELNADDTSAIERPSQLFLFVAIGVVVVLIIIFVIYRKRKLRQQSNE